MSDNGLLIVTPEKYLVFDDSRVAFVTLKNTSNKKVAFKIKTNATLGRLAAVPKLANIGSGKFVSVRFSLGSTRQDENEAQIKIKILSMELSPFMPSDVDVWATLSRKRVYTNIIQVCFADQGQNQETLCIKKPRHVCQLKGVRNEEELTYKSRQTGNLLAETQKTRIKRSKNPLNLVIKATDPVVQETAWAANPQAKNQWGQVAWKQNKDRGAGNVFRSDKGKKPVRTDEWNQDQPVTTDGWNQDQPAAPDDWNQDPPAATDAWNQDQPAATDGWANPVADGQVQAEGDQQNLNIYGSAVAMSQPVVGAGVHQPSEAQQFWEKKEILATSLTMMREAIFYSIGFFILGIILGKAGF